MGASKTTTVFVNKTKTSHVVKMQVGNSQHFSDLASIKEGGDNKLRVNMNDTYREFAVCRDGSHKKEMADGTIQLLRQPRESISGTATASKKPSWFSLWK